MNTQPDNNVVGINAGQSRNNGGGNGGDKEILQRLTRVETKMESLATREDLEKFKVSILRSLLGVVVVALITIVATIIKEFFVK